MSQTVLTTKLDACNMMSRTESFTDQTDKRNIKKLNMRVLNQIQKAQQLKNEQKTISTSFSARSHQTPFKYEGIFESTFLGS